jgi:hypothetical protein
MGVTHAPICGTHLCGDGICGQWLTTWDPSKLLLNGRGFAAGWFPEEVTGVTLGRPKLILRAGAVGVITDSQLPVGRPLLTLKARPFTLPPAIVLSLDKPRLFLRARALGLSLSSSLVLGRPLLILRGGEVAHAGRPGLVPTVIEGRPLVPTAGGIGALTPTAPETRILVPTVPEDPRTLVPTAVEAGDLVPTTPVEDDGDLLVPTQVEVR